VENTGFKVKSFECMDACILKGGVTLRMIVVYRLDPKFRKIPSTIIFSLRSLFI